MSIKSANSLFTRNYLQELPEDIKTLIYNKVYKDNYSIVLNEFITNRSNRKHFNNLKHFLVYQEEPKLNLIHFLSHNICVRNTNTPRKENKYIEDNILSLYKKHLTSNISKKDIRKIKIATNLFKYLDKIIVKTFTSFMNNSTHNWGISSHIYIDDVGEYFVLEYDRYFVCFADLYLMLLSFWQFIRIKLYEFYELHKEAYNLYIRNLLKNDYDTGLYMWFGGNITDNILLKNLVKMKNENASLYRKIIRQRRNINKTECLYINFEISNNINNYIMEDDAIIVKLKEYS
jgi:hypothetical protein